MEKVKLWKKQSVKTFCFIANLRLDKSRVIMASSMLSGNHWSCVHINLETGDGLYADSIGWEVPRHFGDTFSNYFQAIWKVYKEKTLSNPCTLLMKFNEQKTHINVDIFDVKIVINQRNHMIVCGLLQYFLESRSLILQ